MWPFKVDINSNEVEFRILIVISFDPLTIFPSGNIANGFVLYFEFKCLLYFNFYKKACGTNKNCLESKWMIEINKLSTIKKQSNWKNV